MKRLFFVFLFLILGSSLYVPRAFAQETKQEYSTGVVIQITEETQVEQAGNTAFTQKLQVKENGTGVTRPIDVGSVDIPVSSAGKYHVGEKVVLVSQVDDQGHIQYFITDQYRIPVLLWLLVGFFVIVVVVSQMKGLTSLIGMILSLLVLLFYMVPQIVHGANPVVVSILAAGVISAIIIYCGHGFGYRSHISLFCMLVTLALVGLMSHAVVKLAYLNGIGDETAGYLQFSGLKNINLQGLFLGGIILAALSVLDDSVVSQVSVVYQLKDVKHDISFRELFFRGMEVGKDHISTLVNTLILAYAGASLPLFILFTINTGTPMWVSLNDQMIAEEVVRTLTGSIGLVLSIPLTTFVAAYVVHNLHSKHAKKRVTHE